MSLSLPPQNPVEVLYANRKLATLEEIQRFEDALQEIDRQDVTLLPGLYRVFDDATEQEDLMWELIHLIESFDQEPGLQALAQATPSMLQQAAEWTTLLYQRIKNEEVARRYYEKLLLQDDAPTQAQQLFLEVLSSSRENQP